MTNHKKTTARHSSRRMHEKSKRGCLICKQRHVKCDERRPSCGSCLRLDLSCTYKPNDVDHATPDSDISSTTSSPKTHDLLDLELMHHWASCCCVPVPSDHRRRLWVNDVGKLALTVDYLLDQLMAVSAIHILTKAPHRRELATRAQLYRDRALSHAQPALQQLHAGSQIALFAFAGLTMIYSFAESALRREIRGTPYDPITHLIECLRLNRGITAIIKTDETNIPKSWAAELINMNGQADFDLLAMSGHSFKKTALLHRLIDEHEEDVESRVACREALARLLDIIHILIWTNDEHETLHLIHTWATCLRDVFWRRLQTQTPATVMILAYFAAMISMRPKLWWFQDWPRSLMNQIAERLSGPQWTEALEWPATLIARSEDRVNKIGP